MLNTLRERIEKEVINHTGLVLGTIDYCAPPGDKGLFGPDSVCWRVHSDFSGMLVGGMSALLLQMLHPAALSGVWDYSNFRSDLLGRLRRTGQFIAATTFASTQDALNIIERVKKIHLQVQGTTPYGHDYQASNGDLLTWVHVAEMRSFLQAYLLYKNPALSLADQDRYYQETAQVSKVLGATNIPQSVKEIELYLNEQQNHCVFDERTHEVFTILTQPPAHNFLSKFFAQQALHAGINLLPEFALQFYRAYSSNTARFISHKSIKTIAPILRWAVRDSSYYRACRRLDIQPQRPFK